MEKNIIKNHLGNKHTAIFANTLYTSITAVWVCYFVNFIKIYNKIFQKNNVRKSRDCITETSIF